MQRYILPMIVGGLLLPLGFISSSAIAADHRDRIAQSSISNFEQIQFFATDVRIQSNRTLNRTETQVTLNLQNHSNRSRNLTLQETLAIEGIVLVDTQEHSYSPEEISGDLSQLIQSGAGNLTLLLKFKTSIGARPSYLFIERTQGESVTVKL